MPAWAVERIYDCSSNQVYRVSRLASCGLISGSLRRYGSTVLKRRRVSNLLGCWMISCMFEVLWVYFERGSFGKSASPLSRLSSRYSIVTWPVAVASSILSIMNN